MKNPITKGPGNAVPSGRGMSMSARLRMRDDFLRNVIDPRRLLQPFDEIPGILYFVKDAHFRMMAISRESVARLGLESEEEIVGQTDHDYLPADLADKYMADDQWVVRHQKPKRNILEMWFNDQGMRDWIVTDKYPLYNTRNEVVGLIGTIQPFEARRRLLAHLGPAGKAADFIRDHLGDPMMLSEIASRTGLSQRQLQRLFHRVFGMSIQQFIIQSRVHAAIHELIHSDRGIAEIALRFGFSDQSAFTNKFRAVTGLPPGVYRERYVAKLSQ